MLLNTSGDGFKQPWVLDPPRNFTAEGSLCSLHEYLGIDRCCPPGWGKDDHCVAEAAKLLSEVTLRRGDCEFLLSFNENIHIVNQCYVWLWEIDHLPQLCHGLWVVTWISQHNVAPQIKNWRNGCCIWFCPLGGLGQEKQCWYLPKRYYCRYEWNTYTYLYIDQYGSKANIRKTGKWTSIKDYDVHSWMFSRAHGLPLSHNKHLTVIHIPPLTNDQRACGCLIPGRCQAKGPVGKASLVFLGTLEITLVNHQSSCSISLSVLFASICQYLPLSTIKTLPFC